MATYTVKFHIDGDAIREYVVEEADTPEEAVETALEELDSLVEATVQKVADYEEVDYDAVLYVRRDPDSE